MMLITTYVLGFPTGRDFLVPQDKGTEVPSLSRDKGTMGQKFLHCPGTKRKAQNLTTGRDGILTDCPGNCPVPGRPVGQK